MTHKHNGYAPDRTDPHWASRVEREAEQHTARTEAAWHKARRRLDRAEQKAVTAQAAKDSTPRQVEKLWAEVDRRREVMMSLERLMRASPAGSQHRGKGSHRGVARGDLL